MSIGVLTSGGDAPGMNAVIRAVVRSADSRRLRIYGILNGYEGLSEGGAAAFKRLDSDDVVRILGNGGTILKSARYEEFKKSTIRMKALENMRAHQITGLVVIGGDGSFRGAHALHETNTRSSTVNDLRIVCIPASIDNDMPCTKYSIGADTALNTVITCIDKIRDTAYSHKRAFLIQVMGRDCDYLPSITGISAGAHVVLGPHDVACIDDIVRRIRDGFRAGKDFVIIVIAEGLRDIRPSSGSAKKIPDDEYGRFTAAEIVARGVSKSLPQIRPVVLGHVQRGGSPSCFDRVLATRFGVAAIRTVKNRSGTDNQPYMLALQNRGETGDRIIAVPLGRVLAIMKRSPRSVDLKYRFLNQVVLRGFPLDKKFKRRWPAEL